MSEKGKFRFWKVENWFNLGGNPRRKRSRYSISGYILEYPRGTERPRNIHIREGHKTYKGKVLIEFLFKGKSVNVHPYEYAKSYKPAPEMNVEIDKNDVRFLICADRLPARRYGIWRDVYDDVVRKESDFDAMRTKVLNELEPVVIAEELGS